MFIVLVLFRISKRFDVWLTISMFIAHFIPNPVRYFGPKRALMPKREHLLLKKLSFYIKYNASNILLTCRGREVIVKHDSEIKWMIEVKAWYRLFYWVARITENFIFHRQSRFPRINLWVRSFEEIDCDVNGEMRKSLTPVNIQSVAVVVKIVAVITKGKVTVATFIAKIRAYHRVFRFCRHFWWLPFNNGTLFHFNIIFLRHIGLKQVWLRRNIFNYLKTFLQNPKLIRNLNNYIENEFYLTIANFMGTRLKT